MAKQLDIKVLVLEERETVFDRDLTGTFGAVQTAHLILGKQQDGSYKVIKDRYGWFNTKEGPQQPKPKPLVDEDTIEELIDAGARQVKRFLRGLVSG